MDDVIAVAKSMQHNTIHNYIAPGLDSHLIGSAEGKGAVRMFENTRAQNFFITPHTHRFNFACCVLRGQVRNTLYVRDRVYGDRYAVSRYIKATKSLDPDWYRDQFSPELHIHNEGAWYTMRWDQYHSIEFSPHALVLFLEGAFKTPVSYVLEPMDGDKKLNTFAVNDWMYTL